MAADLAFGPEGEQWRYTRSTKTYDLTREGGPGKLTLSTSRGPPGTAVTIDPAHAALVVVDMQNYFLDPRCRHHPRGLACVEPTLQVVERCRAMGVQVVWMNWGLTDHDIAHMPASVQRSFSRSLIDPEHKPPRHGLGADLGSGQGRALVAGEWNTALYAPLAAAVRPADAHCAKNRMSGLWHQDQPLWRHLRARGARTLFFAGVNTDQCVLGTLTDAYNAGWDCVLVEDCCATTTEHGQDVCVWNVANSYGFVVRSDSFMDGTAS